MGKTGPVICETLEAICSAAQRQNVYPATLVYDRQVPKIYRF